MDSKRQYVVAFSRSQMEDGMFYVYEAASDADVRKQAREALNLRSTRGMYFGTMDETRTELRRLVELHEAGKLSDWNADRRRRTLAELDARDHEFRVCRALLMRSAV